MKHQTKTTATKNTRRKHQIKMHVYIFDLHPNPNHIWCLSGVLVWCFLSGVCLVFVWCFRLFVLSGVSFTAKDRQICKGLPLQICLVSISICLQILVDTSVLTKASTIRVRSERWRVKGWVLHPHREHTGNGVGAEHTSAPPQRR